LIVKALCIKEPWISMILRGRKAIEIRSWYTPHRGKLLLCASKSPESPLAGKAVCFVNLYKITRMKKEDENAACCNFDRDAFSWHFKDIEPITPYPVKGQLGIFDVIDPTLLQP